MSEEAQQATPPLSSSPPNSPAHPPSSRHSITLIDARPYSIYLPAAARFTTTSEGHLEDTALLPYDPLFSKKNKSDGVDGKVKLGRVVRIEQGDGKGKEGGEVVLESGERVRYDVLVLSPGSSWAGPLDFPDSEQGVKEHIEAWRKKFESSKGVILVGGGSVGIGTHKIIPLLLWISADISFHRVRW